MQQEESRGSEKGFELGSFGRWARYGFAAVGVLASFAGLALVVLAYLTISPSIESLRASALLQADNAGTAVTDLEASLGSASLALNDMPEISQNLSAGLSDYATGATQLAVGIDSLADQTAVLAPVGAQSMKSAAGSLRASAATLGGQADELSSLSAKARKTQLELEKVKTDLSKAKAGLAKAKREIGNAFDSLGAVLLIGCGMFALVFISLGAYSVALFF